MTEQPAPAAAQAAPPPTTPAVLRSLFQRINAGEFDLGKKDYHQFVVKEVYPLLANGSLTVADLERLTQAYAARNDPYNTEK